MKKILFTLLIGLLAFTGVDAQIANAWTAINTTAYAPAGATIPTVTALDNQTPGRLYFTVELDRTTYDNDTQTTAWTAIGAATKTAVDTQWIKNTWALNPLSDIDVITYISMIRPGYEDFEATDLTNQYQACEDIFIVSGYCTWAFRSE